MKVYAITYEHKSLHHLREDCSEENLFAFSRKLPRNRAESYRDFWCPLEFYHEKDNPIPNKFFSCFFKTEFTFYDELLADQALNQLFLSYGEILPIKLSDSDKTAYAFHCMRAIENEKDAFVADTDTKKHNREKIMRKDKIPSSGLFLIYSSLYTVEKEELGLERNFKMLYDVRGYTGLEFVEVKLA